MNYFYFWVGLSVETITINQTYKKTVVRCGVIDKM